MKPVYCMSTNFLVAINTLLLLTLLLSVITSTNSAELFQQQRQKLDASVDDVWYDDNVRITEHPTDFPTSVEVKQSVITTRRREKLDTSVDDIWYDDSVQITGISKSQPTVVSTKQNTNIKDNMNTIENSQNEKIKQITEQSVSIQQSTNLQQYSSSGPEVLEKNKSFTTGESLVTSTEMQTDSLTARLHTPLCIRFVLMDAYGDGWNSAFLSVTDGLGRQTVYQPDAASGYNSLVSHCIESVAASLSDDSQFVMKMNGEGARQLWENFWTVSIDGTSDSPMLLGSFDTVVTVVVVKNSGSYLLSYSSYYNVLPHSPVEFGPSDSYCSECKDFKGSTVGLQSFTSSIGLYKDMRMLSESKGQKSIIKSGKSNRNTNNNNLVELLEKEINSISNQQVAYKLFGLHGEWSSIYGYGTTFDISSSDGTYRLFSGGLCGRGTYFGTCNLSLLSDGTFIWRVSGALDVQKDTIGWEFCDIRGGAMTEVIFQIKSGKCSPLATKTIRDRTYQNIVKSDSESSQSDLRVDDESKADGSSVSTHKAANKAVNANTVLVDMKSDQRVEIRSSSKANQNQDHHITKYSQGSSVSAASTATSTSSGSSWTRSIVFVACVFGLLVIFTVIEIKRQEQEYHRRINLSFDEDDKVVQEMGTKQSLPQDSPTLKLSISIDSLYGLGTWNQTRIDHFSMTRGRDFDADLNENFELKK